MTAMLPRNPSPIEPSPGRLGQETLGFKCTLVGGHSARSMMLNELRTLLTKTQPQASLAQIEKAIVEGNILGKVTLSNRKNSFVHLRELYGLDVRRPLFRVLRSFAARDAAALPLLGLVCAFCRDPQLRQSFELIRRLRPGDLLPRQQMEEHLERGFPGRFSTAMKKSMAQNVNATWTFSGHLAGSARKVRRLPETTPESAAFAMFAGYLSGLRGQKLLQSRFGQLVARDPSVLMVQLPLAAGRGLLGFKFSGGIYEFDFRRQLTPEEERIADVTA